jgi:thioredoxin reductase (NADPH)
MEQQTIKMYGAPWCPDCKRSKQFLSEQRVPYEWNDIDQDEEARAYVQWVNDGRQIIPTLVFADGSILVEPSNAELAEKLGIRRQAQRRYYDLLVVGGGPAGLTVGLYAAREGIKTLIIERSGVGGQAGITQEIENYPGFPEAVSGADLSDRLRRQAERFEVEILGAQTATSMSGDGQVISIGVQSGEEYCAPAVVLATGATYRRLEVPGEDDFIGAGVHFCATCDGPFYKGQDIVVVGGGNSGFQEGLFLTRFASRVTILERSEQPRASRALQDKVAGRENMEVLTRTTLEEFRGGARLESILIKDHSTGETREMRPGAVFVFIGLLPNTETFKGVVDLDEYGFIVTGNGLETSMEGVVAAGDCRLGSTKQVASAVGEGATAALMVREYLERRGDVSHPVGEPTAT